MRRLLYTTMCMVGMLLPIISWAQPIANFTSNITTGCPPIVVYFTDLSTGSPASWQWNLGNGTVSTLQNPSTVYILPGTYTVSLTVTNSAGTNTKTVTSYINVSATPVVSFKADSSIDCAPKTILFTNQSVAGGTSSTYLWDFGDGTTSTQSSPSHTYNVPGNYTVSLVVNNSNGCMGTLTKSAYIKLSQKPVSNFTATNTASCRVPLTTTFTSTASAAASYLWHFGDGTTSTSQNPSHTYTATGNYNVKLVVTNTSGCKDSINKTAFVQAGMLNAAFTTNLNSLCIANTIGFSNTSSPAANSYTWLFGDGSSTTMTDPGHKYYVAGTYTAKLIAQYGVCTDTAFKTIAVLPRPVINFTAADTVACAAPFTTQFSNTTTGAASYLWVFGDGTTSTQQNPSHTYITAGSYTVMLLATSASGCLDTLIKSNYIKVNAPVATITASKPSGCIPATTSLSAGITSLFSVTNYSWNFGDGTAATSCSGCATTSHTYTAAGTYTVTLTYTTTSGCSYTKQTTVKYGTKPTAAFSASTSSICPGQTVTFTNSSTGGATNYVWLFGDNTSSTIANPSHAYALSDSYTVSLIASYNGCSDTVVQNDLVKVKLPSAKFAASFNCNNRRLFTFTDQSQGADTYFWNFGDGTNTNSSGSTTHTYAATGNYTATLTVTNAATGCTSSYSRLISVYDILPKFSVSDTTICTGVATSFVATSSSNYQSYTYRYGNGASSTSTSATKNYTYSSPGAYDIRLIVTDDNNCKDSITKTSYVNVSGPSVDFTGTPVNGCLPLTVNFQDQSVPNGAALVSRKWSFGDGGSTTTTTGTASRLYTVAGAYTVKLYLTDANGCKDSAIKSNYIAASKPQASFAVADTNVCGGQQVVFTNTSTGSSLNSKWSFGNGATSTTASPSYAYTQAGSYTIKLVVTDIGGCKDSITRSSVVKVSVPKPSFSLSDTFATCPPLVVNCTNTSTGTAAYAWTFGNGSQSVLNAPTTVYTYPGVYAIKLIGISPNGCRDSVAKNVTILGPTGTFSYNATGCSPLTVQFTAIASNTTSYIWDMNDGYTASTATSGTTYTYTQNGKFVPRLILSDGASCLVPIQGLDTVMADKVEGDFNFSAAQLCRSGNIQFTDTVLKSIFPVTSYNWNFGDGGSATTHNPAHNYTTPGTYQVKLVLGNIKGCQDTIIKILTVHPAPNVSAGSNHTICTGDTAQITLQAAGANTYAWSPAAGLSCNTCVAPNVLSNVAGTYTVIGTDTNGCADTAQVSVIVNSLPAVNAGADQNICKGAGTSLQATGAASYTWSPVTGLSCTSCSNPAASPIVTTSYIVTGISSSGCTNRDTVVVQVMDKPVVDAGADKTICKGSSTQLQATGASSYTWSPSAGLSCTTCSNPAASPIATTVYTVIGINANGCRDTDEVTVTINQLPVIMVANDTICAGSSTTLQASGAPAYTWSPATGLSCTACPAPVASPATTTTYTISGIDANGCTGSAQAMVTVVPLPLVKAGSDTIICDGASISLHATGANNYSWSPASTLSCTGCASPVATPYTATTYVVTGNTNGCINTDTVLVRMYSKPFISAGNSKAICEGESTSLQATASGAYTWSPSGSLSCNTCASPVARPAASTVYTLASKDEKGCITTAFVTITVHATPTVNAGTDATVCEQATGSLQATGALKYVWSPATGLSCTSCSDPAILAKGNTVYKVVGTDIYGCSDSDEVAIDVVMKKDISVARGDTVCKGTSVHLSASGGTSYLWFPAGGLDNNTSANPVAQPENTTVYSVVVKQGSCFTDTIKVPVVVKPMPQVELGEDRKAVAGENITLNTNGDNSLRYQWSSSAELSCMDCRSPVAAVRKTATFTVTASNDLGCTAEDVITIFVNCDESQVFVANTFTPNGDGTNDRFFPQGKGIGDVQRFRVYSRWGELLYDRQNIPLNNELYGWDGTYKGQPLKPDVFVYILNTICATGEPIELKGDISLIR